MLVYYDFCISRLLCIASAFRLFKKKNLKETQRLSLVSESTSKQAILTDGQFYLNAIEAKGFSTVSASYKQISINKQH